MKKHCLLDNQAEELLHQAMTELNISARGYNKILKSAEQLRTLTIAGISTGNISQRPFSIEIWIVICGNDAFFL
jgi:predicted ATPase with chaperone activity